MLLPQPSFILFAYKDTQQLSHGRFCQMLSTPALEERSCILCPCLSLAYSERQLQVNMQQLGSFGGMR